jgi:hypothetical protein
MGLLHPPKSIKNTKPAAVLVDLWVSGRVYEVCGKIAFYFSTDEVATYPHIHMPCGF